MNKKEFVRELANKAQLTQKECALCLNAISELVAVTLKKGENITLTGFGKFDVKHRCAKYMLNPKSGEKMLIPASKSPYFKAGKTFKQAII